MKFALACALAAFSAFAPPAEVCACALAPRAGDSVHVAEESAVIIWDAATKTQHFVRRAQFDTKAQDFGFLVPTPTRPVLTEAEDSVFGYLLNLTRPPPSSVPAPAAAKGEMMATAKSERPRAAVVVLEAVTVAGLDAVVLDANDAQALNSWLGKHGYAASAQLTDWYKPYIASKWIITAFKISKGAAGAGRATTSAVRMSFKTEQPFFPYREPATSGSTPRALEVYFVSHERADGRIGAASRPAPGTYERLAAMVGLGSRAAGWPGHTLWAKPLPAAARKELLERLKLPATAIPASAWLTRFLDASSPRPGTDDLFFSRAADQSPYMDERRLNEELSRKESMRFVSSIELAPRAQDDAAAMYNQAVDLENQGKVQDSIRIYRRAARAGNGKAAKRLGDIFDKGAPGISRDFAESLQWYEVARELGEKVESKGTR